MKSYKKIGQTIMVIIIVGIGWVYNLDKKSIFYEHFRSITVNHESEDSKTDSLESKENKLYIYTKDIIDSSIQHIISNL